MTVYDAVFADLKACCKLDELELRKYMDKITATCFMQEREAQYYIYVWTQILNIDISKIQANAHADFRRMITGENNSVPDDVKESVDFVLDALAEKEQTVIKERVALDKFLRYGDLHRKELIVLKQKFFEN